MNHESHSSFIGRGGLWVIAQFILMIAIIVAGPMWGSVTRSPSAALILIAVGAWFGIRGVCDLGTQRTALPRPLPGGQLVTTGIYSLVRHPLYASLGWLGLGWALLFVSYPALLLALIQIGFLDQKARREERWLREHFADYALYASRVKRFVPRIY